MQGAGVITRRHLVITRTLYKAMHKFATLNTKNPFGETDAADMVEEIRMQWPDVKGVHIQTLLALKKGLNYQKIGLEYRLLRGFVAEGVFRLEDHVEPNKLDDTFLAALVCGLIATTDRILGPKSMPMISLSQEATILGGVRAKLREVVEAGRQFDVKLKSLSGDQVLPESINDLWATYGDAVDTDTAKLAFGQVIRMHAAAFSHKYEGLDKMLGSIVKVLDHLNLTTDDQS